jgi:cell division protein FtsB
MVKIAAIVLLSLVLVFMGTSIYKFVVEEHSLNVDLADVASRLTKAQADETDLQAETQYLANPLNLEKELRARFNYKKPGETMIIIVPAQSSTASSTQ